MPLPASSSSARKPDELSSKTAGYLLNKSSFAVLMGMVLFAGWNAQYDLQPNGAIDLGDLVIMAENWLK